MEVYSIYYDLTRRDTETGYWSVTTEPPLEDSMITSLEELDSSIRIFSRDDFSQISSRWPNTAGQLVRRVVGVIEAEGHQSRLITPLPDVPADRLRRLMTDARAVQ